jgi:conjugal transfer pilus assembly protein TraE
MDMKTFTNTWAGIHGFNSFLKIIVLCLLFTNIVSVYGWISKDQLVVFVPPSLNEKVGVSVNSASESYKKAWALFVATLLGNINPDNSDFIKTQLDGMVTGEIKLAISEQIADAIDQLKLEKVSTVFQIRVVLFEPESDHVFVSGHSNMVGIGGKTKVADQTYEFKIDVKQYSPLITYLSIYSGEPRTLAVLEKERQAGENMRKQKETQSGIN